MRFRIEEIEKRNGRRWNGRRVRLSKSKAVRVVLYCGTREGSVGVTILRPTLAQAAQTARDLFGISEARWAVMLKQSQRREAKLIQEERARKLKRRQWQLTQAIRTGRWAELKLAKLNARLQGS